MRQPEAPGSAPSRKRCRSQAQASSRELNASGSLLGRAAGSSRGHCKAVSHATVPTSGAPPKCVCTGALRANSHFKYPKHRPTYGSLAAHVLKHRPLIPVITLRRSCRCCARETSRATVTCSCTAQILEFCPYGLGLTTLLISLVDVLVGSGVVQGWGDMTWAAALCVGDQAI